ncbi:MAG: MFS transporter [Candidatus Woesearchaeota archaeon]
MRRNLRIIYATSALVWARFFLPVLALFYIASQVPFEQFGIIMAVFAGVTLLLEIPSGLLTDLIGKRKALIISRSCYLLEVILLAFTNGFWPFLIAKVISGVGVSLSSGTDSAMLYDTLRRSFKEHRHIEIKGVTTMITNISMGVTFIVGAYLFSINPKLPAFVSIPFLALALALTFFLKEPYKPNRHLALNSVSRHLEQGLRYFSRHKHVKYLVFYALPFTAAVSILLASSSAYYKAVHIPVSLIGVVAFAVVMVRAWSSRNAYKVEKQLGEHASLILVAAAFNVIMLLMALMLPYISVIFYLALALVDGFFLVILDNYLNKHIETGSRATMLSINSLFANLGVVILFPIIGAVKGAHGFGPAYAILAGVVALYMVGFWIFFHRRKI